MLEGHHLGRGAGPRTHKFLTSVMLPMAEREADSGEVCVVPKEKVGAQGRSPTVDSVDQLIAISTVHL